MEIGGMRTNLKQPAILLALIVLMLVSISVLAEARPFTGTYMKDTISVGHGELKIINDNPQFDAVAVLKDTTDERHMLAIHIRSNESYKYSGIGEGSYNLYYEIGNNWNRSSNKFTDKVGFYRLDRSLLFKRTSIPNGYEYSIWTVALESAAPNANEPGQKVSVNEDDFPALK
jgi:hypothetical protein